MKRCILHSDLNNFYASVECLRRPELRDVPVAVCGSFEDRHGVVLAKNMLAKAQGVRTGEAFWQARKKCPDLVSVPADFPTYVRISRAVRAIYARYTDQIEPYGIDECWLDVTGSRYLFGEGEQIAHTIREAVKREIGVTVSVGVSWNKIFAKLASDLKKPDAVTVIDEKNYQTLAWNLPAADLLYVGKATAKRLAVLGIATIGDLARADVSMLIAELGKWGSVLHAYANGWDDAPVAMEGTQREIKSIGNSLTSYRDLTTEEDVRMLLYMLAESVAARVAQKGVGRAQTVKVSIVDNQLRRFGKQGRPPVPTRSAQGIADFAFELFRSLYSWRHPVRALGVAVCDFVGNAEQLTLFEEDAREKKSERLDAAVNAMREKYGSNALKRATVLRDAHFSEMDIRGEHIIRPAGSEEE